MSTWDCQEAWQPGAQANILWRSMGTWETTFRRVMMSKAMSSAGWPRRRGRRAARAWFAAVDGAGAWGLATRGAGRVVLVIGHPGAAAPRVSDGRVTSVSH